MTLNFQWDLENKEYLGEWDPTVKITRKQKIVHNKMIIN